MSCIKKSTGLSAKKDVSCGQIFTLFFLFLLGNFSATLGLFGAVATRFIYEEERDENLTPQEKSVVVYKAALEVEIITMCISILASVLFGYLYEIWSRKKVLTLLTILLAGGMLLPALDIT